MKIGLDYGHNGPTLDPGVVGPAGSRESDRTFEIGQRLKAIFEANGFEVVEFRNSLDFVPEGYTDELGDLPQRAAYFNEAGVAAIVSLHCNGAENPAAQGIEIWTTKGETAADPLATGIMAELKQALPDHIFREDLDDGDLDKESNFYILRNTDAPAVLLETEFLSNPEQEQVLGTEAFQQAVACAAFAGFLAWYRQRGRQ